MKNGLVSIGKMAEMNRVTVATLRLYDQLGLLTPRYTDPDTEGTAITISPRTRGWI